MLKILLHIITVAGLVACSSRASNNNSSSNEPTQVPPLTFLGNLHATGADINASIAIRGLLDESTLVTDRPILVFEVVNNTEEFIRFEYNLNVKIFGLDNSSSIWTEIPDKALYNNDDKLSLSPKTYKSGLPTIIHGVIPDIKTNNKITLYRVIISGETESNEVIWAFQDFWIEK
jgi:hypothetical protein